MKVSKENKLTKKQRNLKSARLIVRNLSFNCNEKSVNEHFSKFGEIADIKLLRKGEKLVGCGFVQYKNKLCAAKAISKLSGNDFMGRPIIVDWALPKDKFNYLSKPSTGEESHEATESSIKKEFIEEETEDVRGKPVSGISNKVADIETTSEESDEESGSDEGSSSDESSDDHGKQKKHNVKEETDEESFPKKPKDEKKQRFRYDHNDVSDGRTVFLKNVPFSVNDEGLIKCAETLGTVIYGIVCMDPLTEHSKGTAFVKYKDKTVVDALLLGKLTLSINGTKLEPFLALKKNQIEEKKEKKTPKDNRNLYLVREGVILAGSPAAEGVSEGDMAKRLQLEHWKTQTLRNLNKFVSPIRLVVHNVPPFVDDNKLRDIFKEHSPKGAIIKEVRIMRNLNDVDEHGIGRSKGFGFVSFIKHEHALQALRTINNNPQVFKESKRPIVGFSIESMVALKLREKRKERSKDVSKKQPMTIAGWKEKVKGNVKKNRPVNSNNENLPTFSGNVARPGMKKMRSRKELSMQAQMHHKSNVERKQSKKKFYFSKKLKSKLKGKHKK